MRIFMMTAVATALTCASGPLWAQDSGLGTAFSDEYGQYLARQDGRPLYAMLTQIEAGDRQKPLESCNRDCLEEWPTATVTGDVQIDDALDSSLADTTRWNGQVVQTFGGHPLFFFHRDRPGAEPQGHGIYSFGGYWALLSPDGKPIPFHPLPDPARDHPAPEATD